MDRLSHRLIHRSTHRHRTRLRHGPNRYLTVHATNYIRTRYRLSDSSILRTPHAHQRRTCGIMVGNLCSLCWNDWHLLYNINRRLASFAKRYVI